MPQAGRTDKTIKRGGEEKSKHHDRGNAPTFCRAILYVA